MNMIPEYVRLIRLGNLAFIAMLLWLMEKWVVTPVLGQLHLAEQLPWYVLLLLMVAAVGIAAGGYVINAYFDVKIDRINHPDQLVVTNTVTKNTAIHLFQGLTAVGVIAGLAAAWLCRSTALATVFVIVPGLMWFYSASYKRQFLVGNLIVAFSSALVPLLVAMANDGYMRHVYGEAVYEGGLSAVLYMWVGSFAVFAFLFTWIREIVKDLEDQVGDRELECHTMPIVLGDIWSKVIVTLLLLGVAAVLGWIVFRVLPFGTSWSSLSVRYLVFALWVPMACELVLLWTSHIPSDYHTTQQLLKFIMLMGSLFSFVIVRML